MPKGKSLWEVAAGAMAQAFQGIEHMVKSQSSGPLPPNQVRWVSMTLVDTGSSVETNVLPMQTP